MNRAEATELLREVTLGWVDDEASAAVWAGEHEGRWGLRLEQRTREATTIWFEVGDITLSYEAYLLPKPSTNQAEVYRQCLRRNQNSWPVWIAMDKDGDLYVIGRIPVATIDARSLDEAVGAVYHLVDLSFRALIQAGYGREKSR